MHPNYIMVISNSIYFAYNLLCNFIHQNQDQVVPKTLEKVRLQHYLLSDIHQKVIDTSVYFRITLNIKFHEFLYICSRAALATKFFSHTHRHTETDRHFQEIVKSCSGHPKTCKSIKSRKSKIFMKPILSSIYIEERKKKIIIF